MQNELMARFESKPFAVPEIDYSMSMDLLRHSGDLDFIADQSYHNKRASSKCLGKIDS